MIVNPIKSGKNTKDATITSKDVLWNEVAYGKDGRVVGEVPLSLSDTSIMCTLPRDTRWTSVCYGNGIFVAVSIGNIFAYSYDGIIWREGIISDKNRNWYSVCYGNDKFVVVANNTGTFAYSYDGINWTEDIIDDGWGGWDSVCYGNNKFVVVSYNSDYGFAYSYDGITWIKGNISDTIRGWNSVCYGNDKFITIEDNSNIFAYSYDGINWTEGTISNSDRRWNSVCYGNGIFVAVSNNNDFAYSYNGITWIRGNNSDTIRYWNSVCYGNGKFVAVANGSNIFAYSEDGINWTEVTVMDTDRSWTSVCYGKDKFVAIANGSNIFAYSYDGINWINKNDVYKLEDTILGMNICAEGCNKRHLIVDNKDSDWIYSELPLTTEWSHHKFSDGMFIVDSVDNNFAYSTDGINWVLLDTSELLNISDICYGNGKFIATSSNGTLAYSDNGFNWQISSNTLGVNGYSIYANGIFVIVEYGANKILYSTDGINWESTTVEGVRFGGLIFFTNNTIIATLYDDTKIVYSNNGIDWNVATINGKYDSSSLCCADNKFVSVNEEYYSISYDGINWETVVFENLNMYISGLAYDGNIYVTFAQMNDEPYYGLIYSTDLINWYPFDNEDGNYPSSAGWDGVQYGNGRFVVTGFGGGYIEHNCALSREYGTKLKFEDELEIDTSDATAKPIDISKGKIAYGKNSKLIGASPFVNNKLVYIDGNSIPEPERYDEYLYSISNENINVIWGNQSITYTCNGITYKSLYNYLSLKSAEINSVYDVVCGNGIILAICSIYFHNISDTKTCALKTLDGYNWSIHEIPNCTTGVKACFANGQFFYLDENHNLFKSNDGESWEVHSSSLFDSSDYCNYFGSANNKIFANVGAPLYYSNDGINFNECVINYAEGGSFGNTSYTPSQITYGNGHYVAGGVSGYTAYYIVSEDGITWTAYRDDQLEIFPKNLPVFFNNRFISANYKNYYENGCIITSTDGINYEYIKPTEYDINKLFIVYKDKIYYFNPSNTSDAIYSKDGINWYELGYTADVALVPFNITLKNRQLLVTEDSIKFKDEPIIITSTAEVTEGSVSNYPENSLYVVYKEE